jgi:hypothetical protein
MDQTKVLFQYPANKFLKKFIAIVTKINNMKSMFLC